MEYKELIELYKGLTDKVFLLVRIDSDDASWIEESTIVPKVFLTVDDLVEHYSEENYTHTVYTQDNGQEFEYEKHFLSFTELPKNEHFKSLFKLYKIWLEKIYVDSDSFVYTESFKKLDAENKKLTLAVLEGYEKDVQSNMPNNSSYHVVVAETVGKSKLSKNLLGPQRP